MVVNMGSLSGQGLSALLLKLLKKTWYFGSFPIYADTADPALAGIACTGVWFLVWTCVIKKTSVRNITAKEITYNGDD